MKIGYRRYSGPVYLDATKVKSKRGAWLEKRIALFQALAERGNTITILKNGDDFSEYDKILVEFGSLNYLFHKPDIDYSNKILQSKKAIFILDDPDLMPKNIFGADVWVNADAYECAKKWKIHGISSFPIYGLQNIRKPSEIHNGKIVYYGGTSGGREKLLRQYQTLLPNLEIYGDKKDYKHIIPKEPPSQVERAKFYSQFMACLSVTDPLHKKLKWNTGRKYHAILAGCPVIEEDVYMLNFARALKDENYRKGFIEGQQIEVALAKEKCLNLFKDYGM